MKKKIINEAAFEKIYMEYLTYLSRYINDDLQQRIARNNNGFAGFDLIGYYRREWKKYFFAYQCIARNIKGKTICDCGGFLGVFAYVLVRFGYQVSIIEALKYYDNVFDPLYDFLKENSIKVIDCDMFDRNGISEDLAGKFDLVCAMDVIEHYPHSLKYFIGNMKFLAGGDKHLFLITPNIAVLHNRWRFLVGGIAPVSDIELIYKSEIPYTGHCHEMTMTDLEKIAKLSNLEIIEKEYVDCGIYYGGAGLRNRICRLICKSYPDTRDNLMMLLRNRKK